MSTYTHGSRSEVTPSALQSFAARNVGFLNVIEQTIDACESNRQVIAVLVEGIRKVHGDLEGKVFDAPLDPEGQIGRLLSQAASTTERLYSRELARLDSAIADRRLLDEDGVVDAYKSLVAVIADYHNLLEDLRERVGIISSLASPVSEEKFTDVDSLMSRLMQG